jgi:hypothetical protein
VRVDRALSGVLYFRACLAKVSDTFNSSTFKCLECRTLYNLIFLNSIPRRLARLNCILCTLVKNEAITNIKYESSLVF